ncbi:MAG: hypothetical protein ACYSTG_10060, partial [Planctomycetota bacterium]
MKTITSNKLTKAVYVAVILLVWTPSAFAYPPDNAAVLYYRACLFYQSNKAMMDKVTDLLKGRIELDEDIEKYVERNRHTIDFALTAADVKNCDWGVDYSKGCSTVLPHYAPLRNVAKLILTDAKILAAQGDYETALSHCVSVLKIARHVSDGIIISYLVGIAFEDLADNCTQDILARMPLDVEALNWFKSELVDLETRPFSIKAAVTRDAKTWILDARVEKKDELLRLLDGESFPEYVSERIKSADEEFFQGNRDYWQSCVGQQIAALDLPYEQAFTRLQELTDVPPKEAVDNTDATLTVVFAPALAKLYGQVVRVQNFFNAIRAAVDIYIITAQTGRLPDE